ncbi:hypothetical protein LFWB_5240 [Candidatus Phytoplasma luffae]|uniref:Uncharacterized protein n=1 Tax=Loofah witches'-broom phytoplasma TaxID=35773 RepID=A0A975FIH9_LOWBP|nr:hypothetical protein [Candidatus Phytoplasma luffae]QTX03090.1 hypothetical protein LFWB_5240 [Candidatus Phytoplasma luffae]
MKFYENLNKSFLYFKEKIWSKCTVKNRYFVFGVISFSIILCLIILNSHLGKERKFYSEGLIEFKDILNSQFIKEKHTDIEEDITIVGIKSMLIGIIVFVNLLGFKKGFSGVSLGTFVGAVIGVWIFILFPPLIYCLEFVFYKLFHSTS